MLCIALILASPAMAGKPGPTPTPTAPPSGVWVTGDSHNHTQFSDGNQYLPALVYQAFSVYKLDWLGSTDHGGEWDRDANGVKYLADTVGNGSGDIWAWDGMLDNWDSFNALRAQYSGKVLFQGLEWGTPGIDEAKTVVLDKYQEPGSVAPTYETGTAMSDFEFLFDKLDDDFTQTTTLGTFLGLPDSTGTTLSRTGVTKDPQTFDKYARGLEAANFLGTRYANSSYSILSHPSRDLLWTALDIRRYNDAAPTVFFGMAGMPGSQKEPPLRGGYDEEFFNDDGTLNVELTAQARTYGGADYITAKLGGMWDSLLGEGRHFWVFCDSDFHETAEEFWPGEYNKDHTFVAAKTPQGIVNGLRSGNSFAVEGQLIDGLEFKAATSTASAPIGGDLKVAKGATVTVTVKWRSPATNNNGDVPKVNHVDLISGNWGPKLLPSNPAYTTQVTNPSTKVAARFTTASLRASKGWYTGTFTIKPTADMYLRLRGTNQGLNVVNQTDANGNPLNDELEYPNDEAKAWADLWFYSNPIFIDVQ
jgi:hypothetical protein